MTVRQVDGGPAYYSGFASPLPSTEDYFPVGVWFESVLSAANTRLDAAAGINTYVELTDNSSLSLVRDADMFSIPSGRSALANGYLLSDEADMWGGPGSSTWSGNYPGQGDICVPASSKCGYTIQQTMLAGAPQGLLTYTNYGKGVAFWETDAEAAKFVNDFGNVVSADTYWFTDPNICGATEGGAGLGTDRKLTAAECRRGANYGWTTERLRGLVNPPGSKPIWNFIEVGHPFTEDDAPTITGPQIRAAVWSSIIHGARGIVYFNHNFGGSCESQHVLRDRCGAGVLPTVTSVNRQIAELAPILNAPFVDGLVTGSGAVDVAVKIYDGHFYILAASTGTGSQQITFTNQCRSGTAVSALGEGRLVSVANGSFSDTFADGNAVHLYRLDGGDTCGVTP